MWAIWAKRYGAKPRMSPATTAAPRSPVSRQASAAIAQAEVASPAISSPLWTTAGGTPAQRNGAAASPTSSIASE